MDTIHRLKGLFTANVKSMTSTDCSTIKWIHSDGGLGHTGYAFRAWLKNRCNTHEVITAFLRSLTGMQKCSIKRFRYSKSDASYYSKSKPGFVHGRSQHRELHPQLAGDAKLKGQYNYIQDHTGKASQPWVLQSTRQ